ncbi:hypothetical protein DCC85_12865 [Paenibacillus sp. CAA11]|uniref:hypothetical protein n=1 Tax=Paenibacillus sp. CAA11 TaxID=1532905 RepID=UPI000D3D4B08|nr:hypothetical protein [Paenibacillus sp. CAA11]AWB45024.1 hypothetical protein DCC85_12865 [Paenibacillus sp. CAA11]
MMTLNQYVQSNGLTGHPELGMVLDELARLLAQEEASWLLGGSSSLWLQGVQLSSEPRDIDIYCDLSDANLLHNKLAKYSIDKPVMDTSGLYRSLLSHYVLMSKPIELVGGFEVSADGGMYQVQIEALLYPYAPEVVPNLKLMPLPHELMFNILRERKDRYLPIAEHMSRQLDVHLPLISSLLLSSANRWTKDQILKLGEVLRAPQLVVVWEKGLRR